MEQIKPVFGVKDIAKYLGLATITIYRLTEKGEIPARKIGGQWRFLKDEVDQWIRDRR
jgi:excisionase family DNA binding protein